MQNNTKQENKSAGIHTCMNKYNQFISYSPV